MGSLQWALSWLMVGAVGLAPILAYWLARLIGRAFRRRREDLRLGNARVQDRQEGREVIGARRHRRVFGRHNSDPSRG